MSIQLHFSKLESLFIESMAPQRTDEDAKFITEADDEDYPDAIEKADVKSISTATHFAPNIYMNTKTIRLPEPYHSIDGNIRISDDFLHGGFTIYPQIPKDIEEDQQKKAAFLRNFHLRFVAANRTLADEKYDDALFFHIQSRPAYVISFNEGNSRTEFYFGEVGAEPFTFLEFSDFKRTLDDTVLKLQKVLNVGRDIMLPRVDSKPIIRSIYYHSDYQ